MIRVLIDENLPEYFAEGLNHIQHPLANHIEITSIAREFNKGIKDEEWIANWGLQSGIFISQDIKIISSRNQALLLQTHKMGAFFLKPPKGSHYWEKVELIVKHWPQIVKLVKTNAVPYIYFITPRKIERG
jgi:hypothetical protein